MYMYNVYTYLPDVSIATLHPHMHTHTHTHTHHVSVCSGTCTHAYNKSAVAGEQGTHVY